MTTNARLNRKAREVYEKVCDLLERFDHPKPPVVATGRSHPHIIVNGPNGPRRVSLPCSPGPTFEYRKKVREVERIMEGIEGGR